MPSIDATSLMRASLRGGMAESAAKPAGTTPIAAPSTHSITPHNTRVFHTLCIAHLLEDQQLLQQPDQSIRPVRVIRDNAFAAHLQLKARDRRRKYLVLLRDILRPHQPTQHNGLRLLAERHLTRRFDYQHSEERRVG